MKRTKTIRTLFAVFCVLVLTFVFVASAYADGDDPIAVVNKLSEFIFGLIRAVGIILLGCAIALTVSYVRGKRNEANK